MGVAVELDQLPAEVGGFLGGGQRLRAPAGLGQVDGEVVHRHGQVGQVGVAVELDQLPVQVGGFLGGGQRLRAPAGVGQPDGEVVHRHGQRGQVGVAVELDQLPVPVGGRARDPEGDRSEQQAEAGQSSAELLQGGEVSGVYDSVQSAEQRCRVLQTGRYGNRGVDAGHSRGRDDVGDDGGEVWMLRVSAAQDGESLLELPGRGAASCAVELTAARSGVVEGGGDEVFAQWVWLQAGPVSVAVLVKGAQPLRHGGRSVRVGGWQAGVQDAVGVGEVGGAPQGRESD